MQQSLAKSAQDQMGRPRMVKSFAELAREAYGPGFSVDQYTQDLAKALATGTGYTGFSNGSAAPGNLVPIALQNLDATMTSVLFEEQHLAIFNSIQKVPSITTYYEWNRRNRYGAPRANGGFAEGLAPSGGTVNFTRSGQYIRYMGVKRAITHPMLMTGQLGGTQVDPIEEENRDGTLELLEKVERNMIFADANITDKTGAVVNYDGLLSYMQKNASQNIIDMGGSSLTFDHLEDLGFNFFQKAKIRNFQNIRLFMTGQVLADLAKLKFQADRREMSENDAARAYITGFPLSGHRTNFGLLPFEPSIFMEDVDGGAPNTTGDPGAPAAYSNSALTQTPGTVTGGTLPAGTYYYAVAGVNDAGEAAGVVQSASVTVSGTQNSVQLTASAADATVTHYRIYRGVLASGADLQWVGKIPAGSATGTIYNGSTAGTVGGAFKFVDSGFWNPTAKGMIVAFDVDPGNVVIAQMSPLLRWPLPINSTQIEWLLLLYHTLVVKAPERVYIYKNIGKLS